MVIIWPITFFQIHVYKLKLFKNEGDFLIQCILIGCGLIIDTSVCSSKGLTTEDGCVFTASSDTVLSHNLLTESEDILVYGLQGKSQYPGVWSLSSLIASNRNLVEVDPNRKDDDIGFILPQEGIDEALCSKALLLSIQNKK